MFRLATWLKRDHFPAWLKPRFPNSPSFTSCSSIRATILKWWEGKCTSGPVNSALGSGE